MIFLRKQTDKYYMYEKKVFKEALFCPEIRIFNRFFLPLLSVMVTSALSQDNANGECLATVKSHMTA